MSMITKEQLRNKIRRTFGYPMVKVELTDDQLNDAIDSAIQEYIGWAVGQSTLETFFTVMLSGGQSYYDLWPGVTEVVSVDIASTSSGINTLFTLDNYFYNEGMLNLGTTTTLIDYYIALGYLDTLKRLTPPEFNWKYHADQNILEIQPTPLTGNVLQLGDYTYDSPGFILVRSYMLRGSQMGISTEDIYKNFYDERWVRDYSCALAKRTLGYIRRKFSSFQGMGNQSLSLDGDALIQEAEIELKELMEQLMTTDAWEGMGIFVG